MKKLKLLPLLFMLALCLLAGCGEKKEEVTAESGETLVYTASLTPVSTREEQYLAPMAVTEDGLYLRSYEVIEKGEIPEGVTPEYEGQYDLYGYKLYYVNQDGQLQETAYQPLPAPENPGEYQNYNSSSRVESLFLNADGSMTIVECQDRSWWDGPEGMNRGLEEYWDYAHYESAYFIRRLDASGQELSTAGLDWEAEGDYDYLDLNRSICDGEGRLYSPNQETVLVFSTDGKRMTEIDLGGWTDGMVCLTDGRVGASTYGMSGTEFAVLDAEKGSVAERYPLENYPEQLFNGGGDYDFYYTSGMRLYGYQLAEKRSEELLSWLDCDLSADSVRLLRFEADGMIRGCYTEEMGVDLVTLTRVPKETVAQKQVLTLGTLEPDLVSDAVLRFNRSHDRVRIEMVDYSQYVGGEDFENSLTKLSTQIMAGDMPDLLAVENLPYEQLAAKGLLEDLYPWIDGDSELNREDYFENVLAASEVNGRLCRVSSGFSVQSLVGASSVVGEEPGWGFDQLEAALATMPEGCTPFSPYTGRDEALMMCLFADLDSYVNWSAGNCDFDNPDFCKLLRFCAQFPAEVRYDGEGESELSRIAAGKQMLMTAGIFDLDEVCYNDQYFGGSCTYIGYPTRAGSGNVLMLHDSYAMSAKCADKEAGWEFLRSFLLPDYQRSQYWLSLHKGVFEEKLAEAMEIDYAMDEEGRYILDENGEKIPLSKGGMGMSDGNGVMVHFNLYGLTQEQADKLMAVIESADKAMDPNVKIYSIVKEEAAAFFEGQKSAEEVAKLIQSKASLYLSEQS